MTLLLKNSLVHLQVNPEAGPPALAEERRENGDRGQDRERKVRGRKREGERETEKDGVTDDVKMMREGS